MTEDETAGMLKLVSEVNGCLYQGDRLNAIVDTVKALRQDPDLAARLGVGMQEAPFCVYGGIEDGHGECCRLSQRAREQAKAYPNLDLDTLTFLAVENYNGDVEAAAVHLSSAHTWPKGQEKRDHNGH